MRRDLTRHVVSLLDTAYNEGNQPSLAMVIIESYGDVRGETMESLFRELKRQCGPPTGQISRVVSKQLYHYLLATEETPLDVVQNASEMFDNSRPEHVSDDELCRYMQLES